MLSMNIFVNNFFWKCSPKFVVAALAKNLIKLLLELITYILNIDIISNTLICFPTIEPPTFELLNRATNFWIEPPTSLKPPTFVAIICLCQLCVVTKTFKYRIELHYVFLDVFTQLHTCSVTNVMGNFITLSFFFSGLVTSATASYLGLAFIFTTIIVYFFLENYFLEKSLRYCVSFYPVLILYFSGIISKIKRLFQTNEIYIILIISLTGVTFCSMVFFLKIILLLRVRIRSREDV